MNFNKIFILIILIIFISLTHIYKKINLKVALCTMGKKENLYIKEFVDYYLNLGIDHIFIYDNNDPNSEKISDVINKSYKNKVTIFENIADKITSQPIAFTNCYKENKYNYDWVFMIDIDEYLILKNDSLKNYLSNEIFKNCDFIKIHWVVATDNNILHYDKRPLLKRFKGPFLNDTHIKTFLRGNIEQLKYDIHSPIESPIRNRTCDNAGNKYNYSNNNANALILIYYLFFKKNSRGRYMLMIYLKLIIIKPILFTLNINQLKNLLLNIKEVIEIGLALVFYLLE